MPYKYIGRTHSFKGKTLWEIVGSLKNFGVGRLVVRNTLTERYPEPSYYRILKVETLPQPKEQSVDNLRKVKNLQVIKPIIV
ncbi:Mitochondrial 28S ribosomal protein S34 [Popillia japonica]|uniref:Mitochondrial 28S ribosomal protein S34 n=1 Tax=Popillia japonica TaxID=7064 RepID=A0AAW1J0J7_POPJA